MSNKSVSFPFLPVHTNLLDSSFQKYKLKMIRIIDDSLLDRVIINSCAHFGCQLICAAKGLSWCSLCSLLGAGVPRGNVCCAKITFVLIQILKLFASARQTQTLKLIPPAWLELLAVSVLAFMVLDQSVLLWCPSASQPLV